MFCNYYLHCDICCFNGREDREARFLASKMGIVAAFRSWAGKVCLFVGNWMIGSVILLSSINDTGSFSFDMSDFSQYLPTMLLYTCFDTVKLEDAIHSFLRLLTRHSYSRPCVKCLINCISMVILEI